MRYAVAGQINGWTFYEATDHGFGGPSEGKPLFGYGDGTRHDSGPRDGEPKMGSEWYNTLEHAMAAAIAEKYTGARGAGGTGVGTAADWFMRMIGAGQLQEAGPDGNRVLMEAVREHKDKPLTAYRIERALEDHGYVIARQPL